MPPRIPSELEIEMAKAIGRVDGAVQHYEKLGDLVLAILGISVTIILAVLAYLKWDDSKTKIELLNLKKKLQKEVRRLEEKNDQIVLELKIELLIKHHRTHASLYGQIISLNMALEALIKWIERYYSLDNKAFVANLVLEATKNYFSQPKGLWGKNSSVYQAVQTTKKLLHQIKNTNIKSNYCQDILDNIPKSISFY
jgi:hypothetical protein